MEKYFNINTKDIRFFREEMSDYAPGEDKTLYEVYVHVSAEQNALNHPTQYDSMLEELGYEFMDRDAFFDYEGDGDLWDKWYKFTPRVI